MSVVRAFSPTAGGPGAAAPSAAGSATIDFGSWPGSNEASVTITGQSSITADARVEVRLAAEASGDHTAADAAYAALFIALTCSAPAEGEGFTIHARSSEKLTGTFTARWAWSELEAT